MFTLDREPIKVANLSGHNIAGDIQVVFEAMPNNLDITHPDDIEQWAITTADALFRETGGNSAIAVALPGLTPLAAAFIAAYHGRFGLFPYIIWGIRSEDRRFIFTRETTSDLFDLRLRARGKR